MHFASTETKRQIFSQSYVEKNSFEKKWGPNRKHRIELYFQKCTGVKRKKERQNMNKNRIK